MMLVHDQISGRIALPEYALICGKKTHWSHLQCDVFGQPSRSPLPNESNGRTRLPEIHIGNSIGRPSNYLIVTRKASGQSGFFESGAGSRVASRCVPGDAGAALDPTVES